MRINWLGICTEVECKIVKVESRAVLLFLFRIGGGVCGDGCNGCGDSRFLSKHIFKIAMFNRQETNQTGNTENAMLLFFMAA